LGRLLCRLMWLKIGGEYDITCPLLVRHNNRSIKGWHNWSGKKKDEKFTVHETRDICSCDTSCASRATRLTLAQSKSESDPQYNETLA